MKTSKLMKSLMAVVAIAVLAVPGVSYAQDSKLSEREERLIYSRAYEAILWGSPALAVMAQVEAGQRDLGAGNTDIVYSGKPMDYRWGVVTCNNQSPYWEGGFSVKDGPVVVEIPPARPDAKFFGSIHDIWWIPLVDFGPAGSDKGQGGKYLVLPPDYEGDIPEGYIVVRSTSYTHVIPGRTIPRDKGQKGWEAAVDYIKTLRIYPLSEAANPKPQKFIDGSLKKYDAQPQFDLSDFHFIDRMVQEEPVQEHDKVMYGMLASLGLERGKKFDPSPEVVAILERAAKDAQAFAIERIHSGEAFQQFWPDRGWGAFKLSTEYAETLGSGNYDRGLFYEYRMKNHFYLAGGIYKGFDPNKPVATAYVMTAKDGSGIPLDATKTYKINIPKDVPMKDFWSIIAYGTVSRTFMNSEKFTVSSNDENVVVNSDGSIDLYLSPKAVKGFEANTVIINPDEDYFLMFRFYGAKPELWEKKWILGDPELVK